MSQQIYVIGYARVSTPKQAQSGESLDDQEKEIRKYVNDKGYTLFPKNTIFRESYTGTTTNRPEYKKALELIKANKGKIKYFVFWDFDRLTRGKDSEYQQLWKDLAPFGVDLRDCYDVIQPEVDYFADLGDFDYDFAKGRPSEEAEYAKVQGAYQERKKILRRLLKPQIRLTQEGYHIGRPDDGYKNEQIFVENKKKCIQVADPERAQFIINIFERRAEAVYSDAEIAEEVNSRGYKTLVMRRWSEDKKKVIGTTGGVPLTVKQLQRIVARVTYAGVVCEKWTGYEPVRAKYKGLVSIDLFNKANRGKVFIQENREGSLDIKRNLSKLSLKRKRFNSDFPLRGIVLCEICNKPYTASPSRSKSGRQYKYYHCERGHSRVALPKDDLEQDFDGLVNKLAFTDRTVRILERGLIYNFRQKEGQLAEESAEMNKIVADLEVEKATLIRSFSTATLDVVRQGIEEQIVEVQSKINKAKAERRRIELKEEDITDFINWGRELMEHPAKMLEDIDSLEEQHAIYGLIFKVFPTHSEILNGTPKLSPFFKLNAEKKVDENQLVTQ